LECLLNAIQKLPPGFFSSPHSQIASECHTRLKEFGWDRMEYLNLLIIVIGDACRILV
jgi:hypothetical protein